MLSLSYQLAASVLIKLGESDLAWIAAERGLNASENSESPAVRSSLIRSVAFALISSGRLEPAINLVESGAEILKKEIINDRTSISVYGTLFLVGSMAAARFGDRSETESYLKEARLAANRLGEDANLLWTAFGPTNVAIHRVNTSAELGDFQTVLKSRITFRSNIVPTERRVRYLLDVARAHSLKGDPNQALETMLVAERMAPEQVRQHYVSRKVVATLIRDSAGKSSVELDRLARRVNAIGSI
ncbi:hypothetical protein [Nocardia testacea]|uniref:hypothetical protein n=1 Tax=Nocardia testacea TaxID=248551 RepID=UPI003A8A3F98